MKKLIRPASATPTSTPYSVQYYLGHRSSKLSENSKADRTLIPLQHQQQLLNNHPSQKQLLPQHSDQQSLSAKPLPPQPIKKDPRLNKQKPSPRTCKTEVRDLSSTREIPLNIYTAPFSTHPDHNISKEFVQQPNLQLKQSSVFEQANPSQNVTFQKRFEEIYAKISGTNRSSQTNNPASFGVPSNLIRREDNTYSYLENAKIWSNRAATSRSHDSRMFDSNIQTKQNGAQNHLNFINTQSSTATPTTLLPSSTRMKSSFEGTYQQKDMVSNPSFSVQQLQLPSLISEKENLILTSKSTIFPSSHRSQIDSMIHETFVLRDDNMRLLRENSDLKSKIAALENQMDSLVENHRVQLNAVTTSTAKDNSLLDMRAEQIRLRELEVEQLAADLRKQSQELSRSREEVREIKKNLESFEKELQMKSKTQEESFNDFFQSINVVSDPANRISTAHFEPQSTNRNNNPFLQGEASTAKHNQIQHQFNHISQTLSSPFLNVQDPLHQISFMQQDINSMNSVNEFLNPQSGHNNFTETEQERQRIQEKNARSMDKPIAMSDYCKIKAAQQLTSARSTLTSTREEKIPDPQPQILNPKKPIHTSQSQIIQTNNILQQFHSQKPKKGFRRINSGSANRSIKCDTSKERNSISSIMSQSAQHDMDSLLFDTAEVIQSRTPCNTTPFGGEQKTIPAPSINKQSYSSSNQQLITYQNDHFNDMPLQINENSQTITYGINNQFSGIMADQDLSFLMKNDDNLLSNRDYFASPI